jgi:DNA-binding winged helix-turn-helix (wHTH) protein/tetratricopeptide (TPR) repeat protein
METRYRFGPFELDLISRLLYRDGSRVALPPKALDLLTVLVERKGQVIGKDELIQLVWPDAIVEEGNLTKNIFVLRKALGETAGGEAYIETIPKRGYRFLASTLLERPADDSGPGLPEHKSEPLPPPAMVIQPRGRFGLVLGLTGAIACLAIFVFQFKASVGQSPRSILVSKFTVAGVPDDSLGFGFTQELAARLRTLQGLRIITPAGSASPAELGRRLKVDVILTGRIEQTDSHMRVAAQLLNPQDESVLWSDEAVNLENHDLYAALRVLAASIAARLRAGVLPRSRRRLERRGSTNSEAYEAFLRGQGLLATDPVANGPTAASSYFARATELDPGFADGWAGLARAQYRDFGVGRTERTHLAEALNNARRALSIDPQSIMARRALVEAYHSTGQDEDGLREAKRVLEIDPEDSDAQYTAGLAYFRAAMLDRSMDLFERYLASHPDDALTMSEFLHVCLFARSYERGIRHATPFLATGRLLYPTYLLYANSGDLKNGVLLSRESLNARQPGPAILYFSPFVLQQAGYEQEAREAWQHSAKVMRDRLEDVDNERTRMFLAMTYAKLEQSEEARNQISQALALNPGDPWVLFFASETYALMGDREAAISALRQSVARGYLGLHYLDYYQLPGYGLNRYRTNPEFLSIRSGLGQKIESLKSRY